jgi:NodT family efflux transporter outer membrane factor (OMF) lipoprotein
MSRKISKSYCCRLFLCLLLFGCKVGPKYTAAPAAPVPANFKETSEWKQAEPRDDIFRGKWWEVFADPELNALEEQVNVSNQDIAAAEAQLRAARAAIRVAKGELLPTILVGVTPTIASSSTNRTVIRSGFSVGVGTDVQVPFELQYEADLFGRIRRNVEANVAGAQASAADVETIRLSVHAELALNYFQLRGLDEQRRLLDVSIAAFEKALQLTKNRYQHGIVSLVDVAQAQTQLDTTRAQATDLGVARSQLEHAIAVLIGKPPAELTIASAALASQPPDIPVILPSELLERRPDVASAERRVAEANALIGVAKAAFFPRLTFNVLGGLESSKLSNLFSWPSRFWSIGPSLAQTAFDGGRRKGLTQEAEANYDSAVATYRQGVLVAFQEVEDNLAALRILAEEAGQQDIAVASSQRSVDLALNRYRGGITTYLEVITAQNALLTNQIAAVETQTTRMTATVSLIKALGGVW